MIRCLLLQFGAPIRFIDRATCLHFFQIVKGWGSSSPVCVLVVVFVASKMATQTSITRGHWSSWHKYPMKSPLQTYPKPMHVYGNGCQERFTDALSILFPAAVLTIEIVLDSTIANFVPTMSQRQTGFERGTLLCIRSHAIACEASNANQNNDNL